MSLMTSVYLLLNQYNNRMVTDSAQQ